MEAHLVLGSVTFVLFSFAWILMPQSFKEELLQWVTNNLLEPFRSKENYIMKKREGKAFIRRSSKTPRVSQVRNRAGVIFRQGDIVRLKQKALIAHDRQWDPQERTRIASLLPDVKGCVQLTSQLGGYWTWSVEDLEKLAARDTKVLGEKMEGMQSPNR